MHQLRSLAAEQLEGVLISGEQCRQHIQPLFLRQAQTARIHHGSADLLCFGGVLLLVPQPIEKFVGIQVQLGGDPAQLVKLLPILLFQHLDEVLHQPVVQSDAVQKHLKGVLACIGVRGLFLRFFLCGGVFLLGLICQRMRGGEHILHGESVVGLLGDLVPGSGGAGFHKGGDAHGGDLLLQLHGPAHFAGLGESDPGGGGQCAFTDPGHIVDVIFKQCHNRASLSSQTLPQEKRNCKRLLFVIGYKKWEEGRNMREYYAAPMEGLTGWRWRQVHSKLFGGADRYYTPFLSPNANFEFQTKELREIDPENNRDLPVVPQILTNRAEYFIWAARECESRGYGEVNLNLGCPSGTVTGKKKGAGLLREPALLRELLDGIFDALPDMRISVKTRIGWDDPAQWPALLEMLNNYPISLLIVHPRVRSQFYKGEVNRDAFSWTREHTYLSLCYNGELWTVGEAAAAPDVPLMFGRGLVADPSLLRRLRGGKAATAEEMREFHDRLYEAYRRDFSGDTAVLHHMRELWSYLSGSFRETEGLLRCVRKARSCREYEQGVRQFFAQAELR